MSEKNLFNGKYIDCMMVGNSMAEVVFAAKEGSVNKFNQATLDELRQVVNLLKSNSNLKGVLFSSTKDVFIVGADITEFTTLFTYPDEHLTKWLSHTQQIFNDIEDLQLPTVMAINGICLGGGFELALTASYRVASTKAVLGLPETKLGIYPGWGGTIRLPRVIGADNAIEWIAAGGSHRPEKALKVGCIDSVVEHESLRDASLKVLTSAVNGDLGWQQRRTQKISPLAMVSKVEGVMCFQTARAFVGQKAGNSYPAPVAAIDTIEKTALLTRDQAIPVEIEGFVKLAKSSVAESLVTIFLSNQFVKKKNKQYPSSRIVNKAAVVGSGIMGGGIAYQSATSLVPILMKDISAAALDLGLKESIQLLVKQFKYNKINETQIAQAMSLITPTLSYGDFKDVDVVIEAVVENEKVKQNVLLELEKNTKEEAIIASNTSTISIDHLAKSLCRPQNFCGMHFFNPVYKMPLVEVIRGKKTSEETVGAVVQYALKMKKVPIVVNDCPGFLVNRVLFPYFFGLEGLLNQGVSFVQIDQVMEKFGWPMGPSYLLDVVGLDTAVHASNIMAASYPDRMKRTGKSAIEVLFQDGRLGQKNKKGFYLYKKNKKGQLKKVMDESVQSIIENVVEKKETISDEEIVERMMFPMIIESARCLEEKIVDTAMEVDLGVVYGLGFPPFRGGVLKYADAYGLKKICEKTSDYAKLYGPCYQPNSTLKALAENRKNFYRV